MTWVAAGMNSASELETIKPPIVGDAPNQPSNSIFPDAPVWPDKDGKMCFKPKWFSNWHWLHFDSSHDRSFCYTCVRAVNVGKLSLASGNIKDSPMSAVDFPTGRMLLLPLHIMSKLPRTRQLLQSLL